MDDESVITRVRLLTTLSLDLLAHSRAEDDVLYGALADHEDALTRASRPRARSTAAERLLHELLSVGYSAPRWLEAYEELMDLVQHHVQDEESALFDIAKGNFSKKELKDLDEKYAEVRQEKREKLEGRSMSLEGHKREEHHAR